MDLRTCLLPLWLIVGLAGCSLAPEGTEQERARLREAGRVYGEPSETRSLPELSAEPTWQEILRRAFLANGDLEAAYHEWAAAVKKVSQDSAWPNANVELGFDYMFSNESMKAWNRTTLSAGFDNDSLTFPFKARQGGKVALSDARAAGERFRAKKFDVQRRVLEAWTEYAFLTERGRIQQSNVDLLVLMLESARGRVRAGGPQQDLLKADVELERAKDELKTVETEAHHMGVMLNAMLGRDPLAVLPPPMAIPGPRPLLADDSLVISVAVESNPELAELAAQVQGRKDAVELARLMYLPDISPVASITGDVSQALGAMIMLPTNIVGIRSEISQMRSMLSATEATLRQAKLDRAGQFVAALYGLRNFERQTKLFKERIVPATERVMDLTRQSYAAGGAGFVDLIDSQRMMLDARLMLAEAEAGREKRLAELEALAGVDSEALGMERAGIQQLE